MMQTISNLNTIFHKVGFDFSGFWFRLVWSVFAETESSDSSTVPEGTQFVNWISWSLFWNLTLISFSQQSPWQAGGSIQTLGRVRDFSDSNHLINSDVKRRFMYQNWKESRNAARLLFCYLCRYLNTVLTFLSISTIHKWPAKIANGTPALAPPVLHLCRVVGLSN